MGFVSFFVSFWIMFVLKRFEFDMLRNALDILGVTCRPSNHLKPLSRLVWKELTVHFWPNNQPFWDLLYTGGELGVPLETDKKWDICSQGCPTNPVLDLFWELANRTSLQGCFRCTRWLGGHHQKPHGAVAWCVDKKGQDISRGAVASAWFSTWGHIC